MDLGLTGKRALVTASSGGLGFACAHALAQEGATVAVASRDPERAQQAAGKIGTTHAFDVDVSDKTSLETLFANATSDLGGLDVLICNAGGPPPGGFTALAEDKWDLAYQLTLQSVVRSVRLALPHFEKAGGGVIVVITSSSVKSPIPNLLLSNVFRPAIQGLCKSLAIELASKNIRVLCLSPGRIETDRVNQLDQAKAEREGKDVSEVRNASLAAIPMGRLGEPAEFGRVAAFLCSEAASYMTGSTLFVDGGSVKCL
ncbi:MAG: SDR family oxidoreductase [Deinococcota bacterium]